MSLVMSILALSVSVLALCHSFYTGWHARITQYAELRSALDAAVVDQAERILRRCKTFLSRGLASMRDRAAHDSRVREEVERGLVIVSRLMQRSEDFAKMRKSIGHMRFDSRLSVKAKASFPPIWVTQEFIGIRSSLEMSEKWLERIEIALDAVDYDEFEHLLRTFDAILYGVGEGGESQAPKPKTIDDLYREHDLLRENEGSVGRAE